MIKFIGYYSSGEWYGDKEKIFVKIQDSTEIHSKLFPYLNAGIKIKIAKDEFTGLIESESTYDSKTTLNLILSDLGDRNAISRNANKDVEFVLEIDPNAKKTKTYSNRGYLSKIRKLLSVLGRELGYTYGEMLRLAENQYSEIIGELFILDKAAVQEPEQLPEFMEYIKSVCEKNGITTDNMLPEEDKYLRIRRRNDLCCICDEASVDIICKYSVCDKHKQELLTQIKLHPTTWERQFKNKYSL